MFLSEVQNYTAGITLPVHFQADVTTPCDDNDFKWLQIILSRFNNLDPTFREALLK